MGWWGMKSGDCSCCEGVADCDCAVCDGETPCCIRVAVYGLVGGENPEYSCFNASNLNGVYDLAWQDEATGVPELRGTSDGLLCEWGYQLAQDEQECGYTWALFRIEYRTYLGTVLYYPTFAFANDDGSKFVLFLDNAVAGGLNWDQDCMAWDDSPFDTIVEQWPVGDESQLDLTDAQARVTAYEAVNEDGTCDSGKSTCLSACSTGQACEEYTVTINGIADDTCTCTQLNGAYVVTRASNPSGNCCRWTYSFDQTYSCSGCKNNTQGVYLNICYNASWPAGQQARLEVGFFSGGLQDEPTCYYPTFRKMQTNKFNCENLSAAALTPYTSAAQGCDVNGATCTVTGGC